MLHIYHACASFPCTICFIYIMLVVPRCVQFASYFSPYLCFHIIVVYSVCFILLLLRCVYFAPFFMLHINCIVGVLFVFKSNNTCTTHFCGVKNMVCYGEHNMAVDGGHDVGHEIEHLCAFAWGKRLIMDYEAWFIALEAWLLIDGSKLSRFVFLGNMSLMCLKHL